MTCCPVKKILLFNLFHRVNLRYVSLKIRPDINGLFSYIEKISLKTFRMTLKTFIYKGACLF